MGEQAAPGPLRRVIYSDWTGRTTETDRLVARAHYREAISRGRAIRYTEDPRPHGGCDFIEVAEYRDPATSEVRYAVRIERRDGAEAVDYPDQLSAVAAYERLVRRTAPHAHSDVTAVVNLNGL